MNLIGLVRIGRDAETRYTQSGKAVTSFAAAFDAGQKKQGDKYPPSQWVELSIWGERGEKLAPHLLKGTRVMIVATDPRVETFDKRDGGTGVKFIARVENLEFVGGDRQEAPAPEPRQQRQQRQQQDQQRQQCAPAPAPKSGTGFDDMDDDIPF